MGIVVVTPLDLRDQAVFAGATFAVAMLVARARSPLGTLTLALLSAAVSGRYLFWRFTRTLGGEPSIDTALGSLLLVAEVYASVMLLLGYFQSAWPMRRRPAPLPEDVASWPTVDVLIPTYNEPLEVVRATVLAARALDWPAEKLRVFILDDGRRGPFRAFAAEAGVGYLVREGNAHAKAGNLNRALGRTSGEFIAIFDCDHVPTRSFLQLTMGGFLSDPRLAMVQTPHHFYSPDPFERNLRTFGSVPNEGELFYGLIQGGNDLWNAAFFCGSCAVLRRSALEEIGGITVDTVTEDAHTALRLHRRGWHTAFLGIPQAAGLATESLSAHIGQRIRWARGMAQIFRIDNPLLGRGLSLPQRLCYASAMLHFLGGIPRLVFLLAPLAYLLFDLHIFNALPLAALAYGLPHLVHATHTNSRIQGDFRHSFWSEVYETCLAFYTALPTTLALVDPRAGAFNVTAKGGRIASAHFDWRIARPYLVVGFLQVVAVAVGVVRLAFGRGQFDSVAVNAVWALHNLILIAAVLSVAWEQRQVRASPRIAVKIPAMLRLESGETVACRTLDLARSGARLSVPAGPPLERGAPVAISLLAGAEERPLPAAVVAASGGEVRLAFSELDLEEEATLVETIFSRADAWTRPHDGRRRDRPLAAFRTIAWHALEGVGRFARALRPGPAPASAPPAEVPAPVRSGA
jgi:cellulose synthase (UDP-forming)